MWIWILLLIGAFVFTVLLKVCLLCERIGWLACLYCFGEYQPFHANGMMNFTAIGLSVTVFCVCVRIMQMYAKDKNRKTDMEKHNIPAQIAGILFVCYLQILFLIEICATFFRTTGTMVEFYDQRKDFAALMMVAVVSLIFLGMGRYFFKRSKVLYAWEAGILFCVVILLGDNAGNLFRLMSNFGFTINRGLALCGMIGVVMIFSLPAGSCLAYWMKEGYLPFRRR